MLELQQDLQAPGSRIYLDKEEPALKKWPVLCIETHNLGVEGIFKSPSACRLPHPPPHPQQNILPQIVSSFPAYFQELLFWTQEHSSFCFSSIPSKT